MRFSVIVPLYNRPEEIRELLESLVKQTFQDFEV
ncbi:MAG: glycosyltransferase, partial [Flavobacteriales bacterium]